MNLRLGFVEHTAEKHKDERLGMVTSGIAIKAFAGSFIDWIYQTFVPNISLTIVEMYRGELKLVTFAQDIQQRV